MVSPQGQPSRQPTQPSPFRQTFNLSAQPFIPAAEAQQNDTVPNMQELKVLKSTDGKGVKNGGPDNCVCFCCGEPGHLKKDCPLGPYCSCCDTRGHTPVNCPNKRRPQQNKMHKSGNWWPEGKCKNWKRTQDQPQYSNSENKCLHCAGDHRSCDCLTRYQHQALPATNPVGSTGTHSPHYFPWFSNPSPQHHSQQSQSAVGSSTPTLMVNNNPWFQQEPQGQVTPPGQNQVNQQIRPSQPAIPQYNHFSIHQQSPIYPSQQFSTQYPPNIMQDNGHCNQHMSTQMLLKHMRY